MRSGSVVQPSGGTVAKESGESKAKDADTAGARVRSFAAKRLHENEILSRPVTECETRYGELE